MSRVEFLCWELGSTVLFVEKRGGGARSDRLKIPFRGVADGADRLRGVGEGGREGVNRFG